MPKAEYRTGLQDFIRKNAQPPDKFSHQARLYALAKQIGEAEGKPFDDDVVFAAAWLHDLGVFIGHRPKDLKRLEKWDHVAYAIAHTPSILNNFNFPATKIPGVCEAIRTHMVKDTPNSFEGVLLRDADILEQLGTAGILRVISKVGRDTRFKVLSDAIRILRGNLEELPRRLRLNSARRVAKPRIKTLRMFLMAADRDSLGIDW